MITVLGLITVIPSMFQLPIAVSRYPTSGTDAFFLAVALLAILSAPLFRTC